MNDLLEFLTSEEIIIVYIIAALACLICFIVYIVEKNNEKIRQKHNTKELNKLVEEIKAMFPEEGETTEIEEKPVLETLELENTAEIPIVIDPIENTDEPAVIEESYDDELEYTTVEPDQATARLELQKIREQLEKEEVLEIEPEEVINKYEEEQEKSAIISLEELIVKGKELYESNESTQYADEGNEPISVQDLEVQVNKQAAVYDEPFIIANVVPEEELKEGIKEAFLQHETKEVLHMDDFQTIKEETVNPVVKEPEVKKFKCSPIISPIFGIEKNSARDNAIALENTANYEKLDAALRKNNEFYMTMNELQGKSE